MRPARCAVSPINVWSLLSGDEKWTAATDMAQLVPKVPGLVSEYLPQLKYLMIDENNYSEEELLQLKGLIAAVINDDMLAFLAAKAFAAK